MSVIYILVGASIAIAGGFLAAFIFSVKNGQFDDDYTPSIRMLFDDTAHQKPEEEKTKVEKDQLNNNHLS